MAFHLDLWPALPISLAALYVALGLAGSISVLLGAGLEVDSRHSPWIHLVQILAFSASATWLLVASQRDRRTLFFGAALLLVASGYAERPMQAVAPALPPSLGGGIALLRAMPPDAFFPLFLWLFFRDFPRAVGSLRSRAFATLAIRCSVLLAIVLVLANLALWIAAPDARWLPALRALDRKQVASHYWTLAYGLAVPALPFALWRLRTAPLDERRRVSSFVGGIVLGATPAWLYIFAGAFLLPAMRGTPLERSLMPFLQLGVLSIPVSTAYAIAVHRALDARLVVRKTIQYSLARATAILMMLTPLAFVAVTLGWSREVPLGELLRWPRGVLLLGPMLLGAVILGFRGRMLAAIDRRFFREAYDANRILGALVERMRGARGSRELASLVASEIDRALHLDTLSVLGLDAEHKAYVRLAGSAEALPASSPIVRTLMETGRPIEVSGAPASWGPQERAWIAAGGFELLVPLQARAAEPHGILGLGTKRSELSFSGEDILLLGAIAGSAALLLERLLVEESRGQSPVAESEHGVECVRCGSIQGARTGRCAACDGEVEVAPVPAILFGKFLFERRIGSGAMGVVYVARDLTLDRQVAIKTLPQVTPEQITRLRREARAMAAVSHLNLAMIFGVETWNGTPMLVCEYLKAGTLADRLEERPLAVGEALGLGCDLASALQSIHSVGVLHRDIKPSNIGFSESRTAKLLDFGLARVVADDPATAVGPADGRSTALPESGVVGTPLYLAPEALRGEAPDARFDLWSLALVLYEAIAGRHPLEGATGAETRERLARMKIPDIRTYAPACPEPVARLLALALSRDAASRPASAGELLRQLRAVSVLQAA